MRSRLQRDLRTALKARDEVAVAAIRSAIAAIDNAESVVPVAGPQERGSHEIAGASLGLGSSEASRRLLGEADMRSILRAEVDERREAEEQYRRLGRSDVADRLQREAETLRRYLTEA